MPVKIEHLTLSSCSRQKAVGGTLLTVMHCGERRSLVALLCSHQPLLHSPVQICSFAINAHTWNPDHTTKPAAMANSIRPQAV